MIDRRPSQDSDLGNQNQRYQRMNESDISPSDDDNDRMEDPEDRLLSAHGRIKSNRNQSDDMGVGNNKLRTAGNLKDYLNIADVYISNKQIDKAIELMLQCIESHALIYDRTSREFITVLTDIVSFMNNHALRLLNDDQCDAALDLLKICNELTMPEKFGVFPGLRILTFNHFGCAKRRQGHLKLSLRYLLKALAIITTSQVKEHCGITHLNICAVYSQLGDHEKALDHAKSAVLEFSHEYVVLKGPGNTSGLFDGKIRDLKEKAKFLAIAYYNMGAEEEFFCEYENAITCYDKAYKTMEEVFGENEPLITKIKKAYLEARDVSIFPRILILISFRNGSKDSKVRNRERILKHSVL